MKPGGGDLIVSQEFVRPNPGCGHDSPGKQYPSRTYTPQDFRPVCECLLQAIIPRHCESNRCYNNLYEAADESVVTLREQCGTYQGRNASFPLSKFRARPECGTEVDNVLVMTQRDYRPVCACIRSQEEFNHPASNDVIYRDGFGPHTIDVFLHVVVISKSSLRARRFNTKGDLESEFHHIVLQAAQTGIIFNIKSIDLTIDATWATGQHNEQMRKALHKGDNRDLNFYMIDELDNSEIGYAPIPKSTHTYCTPPPLGEVWKAERIGDPILDGCIVTTGTTQRTTSISMQRWIGTCKLATR
ncbi:hypothetical protein CDD82_357 [Ophiocordyceps australis]|uniref:Uncharacterized protein n=1 Tax=Ophiocordyceps australis TaxID=1399860 RepID=A0A2C5ZKM0_9HYPO|nr:hypothetical protein CDD82_357 [Ophiocordyceps australis]